MSSPSVIPFVRTRDQLDAILAARSGELRDTPYHLLLLALAVREKNAVILLHRGPIEKEIFLISGAAADCQSNIATETLGRFLVSSGRLAEREYQMALSAAASLGVHVEDVLAQRNIIAPADLDRARQQNLGRKLLEPFSWKSGSWRISYDVPPIESALRVRIPQLVATGIAKVEPLESIEAAIDAWAGVRISAGSSPFVPTAELRLNAEQQHVLERVREGVRVGELRDAAPSREDFDRFLFAMLLLGVAAQEEVQAPKPAVIEVKPAAPTFELDVPPDQAASIAAFSQPAVPAARIDAHPRAEEVAAAWVASRDKDAFDLLGADVTTNPMEIARAFIRIVERFLPSQFADHEETREKAQEVVLAAARAYAELADPMRRQALIERRSGPRPFVRPEPAPVAPAPPPPPPPAPSPQPVAFRRTVIDPEELHRQGSAAAAAGRLREALGYFEMAADCDAQNGTYAAEVAYCRFQLMISPAAAALKSLKNAIRIDPRCGVAYLYAGKVQEALGNHVEAQAYFGRASSLNARARGL